jgi:hypothetical protein
MVLTTVKVFNISISKDNINIELKWITTTLSFEPFPASSNRRWSFTYSPTVKAFDYPERFRAI